MVRTTIIKKTSVTNNANNNNTTNNNTTTLNAFAKAQIYYPPPQSNPFDITQFTKVLDGSKSHDPFLNDLLDKFDNIKIGDYVRIVGKDAHKGHIGLVEGIYVTKDNTTMFKIQLQTNGETIDKLRINLKRHFF
jgi:hypothetical protein